MHHILLLLALIALPSLAPAQRPGVDKLNLDKRDLAIDGYDPVAYFPEGGGKPTKGDKQVTLTHRGVTYRFANEANRSRFQRNPVRYEPAYGGWCAWAMAKDDRVEIDPESFLIQDGELLLFFDGFFADTRKQWRKGDVASLKSTADRLWAGHLEVTERDLTRLNLTDGTGAGGFDPVTLLDPKVKDVAGSERITYAYRGVTYRFANAANRDRFRRDPSSFEPDLGGWDPTALSAGKRVAGVPQHALLHEGRILLFADAASRSRFQESSKELFPRAVKAFAKG